jgi:hypothetical protein
MNSLVTANLSCLRQGIAFLESLPAGSTYSQSCEEVFNSTIGGHMRHNLDHYVAFVHGLGVGRIDYDARERVPELETSPRAAVSVIHQLIAGLESLGDADLDRRIQVRMDDGGDTSWSETSLRRELQFLLSHSIHHYALIVSIASRFGITEFPDNFGIAPSTLHFQSAQGA